MGKARKNKGPLKEVWGSLMAMLRMMKAYFKGDYREIPWETMALIVVAVVYFVSPIDLIPDFIPIAGYIDDAFVISLVVASAQSEMDDFEEWELERQYKS